MSFLCERWQVEVQEILSEQEDKNALLMRLVESLLTG